jgi:hypothetical protein
MGRRSKKHMNRSAAGTCLPPRLCKHRIPYTTKDFEKELLDKFDTLISTLQSIEKTFKSQNQRLRGVMMEKKKNDKDFSL